MTLSSTLRQTAPDRVEIRSGGGCISLFGIPFLLAGIFMMLVTFHVVSLSNAEEVPRWAWPLMLLMGLAFVAAGGGLVFGRTRLTLDAGAGRVTREQRALVRLKLEEHSLLDYRAVRLGYTAGDSESAESYDIALQGQPGRAKLGLLSLSEYGPALSQAGVVARVARLPLVDATTDHEAVVAPNGAGESLRERMQGGERTFEEIEPPDVLRSQVDVEGQTVRIRIPNRPLTPFALAALVLPVAILLYFGPRILRFFDATGTPVGFQMCASAFAIFFLAGVPLLEFVNASLRARHGCTFITTSAQGISIEERGAWRRRVRTILAADILGLDYSTPESALRLGQAAVAERVGQGARFGSGWVGDEEVVARAVPGWVGRAVKGRGVVIKTREGLVEFGAGLPGPEIHYLWAITGQALRGTLCDKGTGGRSRSS